MSRDLAVPDNVAVANGVVYAVQTGEQTAQHISNPEGHGRSASGEPPETIASLAKFRSTPLTPMVLYALDAKTGKELYSSGKLLAAGCISASRPWRWARCSWSPTMPMSMPSDWPATHANPAVAGRGH